MNNTDGITLAVALRAVTFDFWSTLVDGVGTPATIADRIARLHQAIVGAGHERSPDELRRACGRGPLAQLAEQLTLNQRAVAGMKVDW